MKKWFINILALTSLIWTTVIFANKEIDNAYHIKKSTTVQNGISVPATNITILNYSEESIFVVVPGTSLYDLLYAGRSDTIFNNSYYGDTRIMLQDWNRITFFDQYVCRRAILTVDGRPGSYRIMLDKKYC